VRLQAFAGAALYLYLPENILQMPEFFGQIAAFLCSSVHLPVEAGYGCSLSVASNGFVRTNLIFTFKTKTMHPYEWGILGVKALDFYPLFDCADCSHCSCCCDNFVAALASIAPVTPG
jgi:hypothetical protein